MCGGVPVLLAADQAEVSVLETEKEDVGAFLLQVVLDARDARVGNGKLDVAVHADRIGAEKGIAPLLVAEVEGEIVAGGIPGDEQHQVLDPVLVHVAFGGHH